MPTLVRALLEQMCPGVPVAMEAEDSESLASGDVVVECLETSRRLVVFGSAPTRAAVAAQLRHHSSSLITIDASRDDLAAAVGSLFSGPAFASSAIVRGLADEPSPNLRTRPTSREHEVLRLLAAGHSNAEMAADLSVSTNTVRSHLQSLSAKLGASSRTKLVARARELGLV